MVAILLSTASCSIRPDDIRLEGVRAVESGGVTLSQARVNVVLGMINESRVKVTLRDVLITVSDARGDIMDITLDEPVVLPKRRSTDVSIPLIARFKGGFGSLTGMARLSGNPNQIRLSGSARLKGSGINKTYRFDYITLREFLNLVGVDRWEDLMNSF